MITPTVPFVAILESDATNDDWITDHAGDPDDIDWSTFTEGTDAIVLRKVSSFTVAAMTGVQVEHLGGGISYDSKYGKRFYQFTIAGIVETWAEANYLDKFAMDDEHSTGTSFKRPYLIDKKATSDYKEFTDENNARLEYCPCNILGVRLTQNAASPLLWTYQIQAFSVMR